VLVGSPVLPWAGEPREPDDVVVRLVEVGLVAEARDHNGAETELSPELGDAGIESVLWSVGVVELG
jgi:hypothetical protein